MILSFLLKKDPRVYKYLEDCKDRAVQSPLAAFSMDVKHYKTKKHILAVFSIDIKALRIYFISLPIVIAGLILEKENLVYAGLTVNIISFFWTGLFFRMMILFGLRKAGCKKGVKILCCSSALKKVVENGAI